MTRLRRLSKHWPTRLALALPAIALFVAAVQPNKFIWS